ncbi:hypothetical protein IV203_013411 [Nitzschia inconspicua]|uniref:Sulfotransferase n=1 Tax=Nitzschia inconspicua TaxID=303405 RepID=A0A9K3M6Y5_9STRA|nr:hypothetical protein IV203_013411 [Nitzschia inconspicua]
MNYGTQYTRKGWETPCLMQYVSEDTLTPAVRRPFEYRSAKCSLVFCLGILLFLSSAFHMHSLELDDLFTKKKRSFDLSVGVQLSKSNNHNSVDPTTSEPTPRDDARPEEVTIKIPYPVYVASLYKSGTTSIHDYFVCGNQSAVHHGAARGVLSNLRQNRDPFSGFPHGIFSDLSHFRGAMCFEPSSAMRLESMYRFHPNMTIVLAVRNSTEWVESVNKFYNLGYLLKTTCRRPGYFERWPKHQNVTDRDLQTFYEWQVEYVRQFSKDHPSITYIEIQLEDPGNGVILEDHIGIPAKCWGHSNKAKS